MDGSGAAGRCGDRARLRARGTRDRGARRALGTPRRDDVTQRWTPVRALVVAGIAALALLGWQGVTTVGRDAALDTSEHVRYAEYLDVHHRIPSKDENYEY